jgi:hypothetical protein
MTKEKSRWSRRRVIFGVAGVLTIPLFLLLILFVVNAINPMATAFLTTFEVVNQTNQPITVTPVGAVGEKSVRKTLPLSVSGKFSWPAGKSSQFQIQPNSTRTFHYDWDDVQFCEILIEDEKRTTCVFETGLHATEDQYRRPVGNRFVIRSTDSLPLAKPHHDDIRTGRSVKMMVFHLLMFLGLLCPLFFSLSRSSKKTTGKKP